jgi:hypothetical protein
MMAGGLTGSVSTNPALNKLTLDNVMDGHVKYKNLKKDQLKEACATFLDHIKDLELRLEKTKAPKMSPPPTRPLSSGQSSRS